MKIITHNKTAIKSFAKLCCTGALLSLMGSHSALTAAEHSYTGDRTSSIIHLAPINQDLSISYSDGELSSLGAMGINGETFGSGNLNIQNAGYIDALDRGIRAYSATGDIDLLNGGSINTRAAVQGIEAYSSAGGDITMTNTGSISTAGTYGLGLTTTLNGNITVNNAQGATISASGTHGIYAATTSGHVSITNHGAVNAGSAGAAGSIYAYTAGTVDILNTGKVSSSGTTNAGIYIAGNVTGGTIRNTGTIETGANAIHVLGRNVRVELFDNDQGYSTNIVGNIVFANAGNTLAVDSHGQHVHGNINIGGYANTSFEVSLAGAVDGAVFLNATGNVNISNVGLTFNLDGASLSSGDTYTLISGSNITGSFANYDFGSSILLDADNGLHEFMLRQDGNTVLLDVISAPASAVPEPSTYAAIAGLALLVYVVLRRPRR